MSFLCAKYFIGGGVSFGRFRAYDHCDWTAALTRNGLGTSIAKGGRTIRYAKTHPLFDIYGGFDYKLRNSRIWSNSIGIGFGTGTATKRVEEPLLAELDQNAGINGKVPIRGSIPNIQEADIHSLRQKFLLQYKSTLGIKMKNYKPYFGVTLLFNQYKSDFANDLTRPRQSFPSSKWVFGYGPTVGIKYSFNKKWRLSVMGEALYYNNMSKSMNNIPPFQSQLISNMQNSASCKIKPSAWRVGIGIEYKFHTVKIKLKKQKVCCNLKYKKRPKLNQRKANFRK